MFDMAMGRSRSAEETFGQAIGAIHEAALSPDQWPEALRRLRQSFGTASTAYVRHT
jgi:hypothetical protein